MNQKTERKIPYLHDPYNRKFSNDTQPDYHDATEIFEIKNGKENFVLHSSGNRNSVIICTPGYHDVTEKLKQKMERKILYCIHQGNRKFSNYTHTGLS